MNSKKRNLLDKRVLLFIPPAVFSFLGIVSYISSIIFSGKLSPLLLDELRSLTTELYVWSSVFTFLSILALFCVTIFFRKKSFSTFSFSSFSFFIGVIVGSLLLPIFIPYVEVSITRNVIARIIFALFLLAGGYILGLILTFLYSRFIRILARFKPKDGDSNNDRFFETISAHLFIWCRKDQSNLQKQSNISVMMTGLDSLLFLAAIFFVVLVLYITFVSEGALPNTLNLRVQTMRRFFNLYVLLFSISWIVVRLGRLGILIKNMIQEKVVLGNLRNSYLGAAGIISESIILTTPLMVNYTIHRFRGYETPLFRTFYLVNIIVAIVCLWGVIFLGVAFVRASIIHAFSKSKK